jgi:hypothetical protein
MTFKPERFRMLNITKTPTGFHLSIDQAIVADLVISATPDADVRLEIAVTDVGRISTVISRASARLLRSGIDNALDASQPRPNKGWSAGQA